MTFRNRRVIFGAAFLAPLLVLVLWFVSAPSNRCNLYQNLGYIYLAKGTLAQPRTQLAMAERWFTGPLLAECEDPSATFGLGQSFSRLGQPSSAISALNDGAERIDLRRFLIGRIYDEMGRPEDAWRIYQSLPRDAAAYFNRLAYRSQRDGDFEKALHYFSVSATINPVAPKAYYGAAFVYWRRLGDQDKAVEKIQQALAVDQKPSVEREFYRGLLCYLQERNDCALASWVSAVRHTPTNETDSTARYLAYEMLGRALSEHRRFTWGHLAVVEQGRRGFTWER